MTGYSAVITNILKISGSLIGDEQSLRRQTIFGSQVLLFKSFAQAFLDLLKTAVFARILFPSDYGLVALAAMAIGMLESFSALGIELLILKGDDGYKKKLNGYWTIKCLRGVLLAVLAWVAAVPLAEYYQKTELIAVVRFLALSFLLNGLAGFGREIRQRQMEFGRVAVAEISASLTVFLTGLIFLFWFRNYWALVLYTIIHSFSLMIVSYILFPWKPRLEFRLSILKSVVIFSGSIIAINILNYLFNNLDKAMIGQLLGVERLGYYVRAYFLALIPANYIFNVIAPVILPGFRNLRDDPARLRQAFTKVVLVFSIISILIGSLAIVFSKYIVLVLYGAKWDSVVPIFQILIIFGVSKGIISVCPSIFFIKGKPWLLSMVSAVMVGCFAIICWPLTVYFNVTGTAWAVVISALISHGIALVLALRLLSPGPPVTKERIDPGNY